MTRIFSSLAVALVIALAASAAPAQDCETLAADAGRAEGLPDGLMPAIARVESGRRTAEGDVRAWPWTLNEAGKGHFFATKAEALDHLATALQSGVENIDIGCMQINHRWHAEAFTSVEEMMDPLANTRYAARFLRELRAQLGSWQEATRAYHSRDADRGAAYEQRVAAVMSGDTDLGEMATASSILDGVAPDGTAPEGVAHRFTPAEVTGVQSGLLVKAATPLFGGQEGIPALPAVDAENPPQRPRAEPSGNELAWADPDPATLLAQTEVPAGLQEHWDDVAQLRAVLAAQP